MIGGVNLVFAHNKSPLATGIKIAVVVAGFALIVFGNFDNGNRWWPGFYISHNNWDDNDNNDDDDSDSTSHGDIVHVKGSNTFNEPYQSVREARLNISGGATTYKLGDTTNDLFRANTTEFFGKYKYDHHMEDSVFVLDFKMKDHNGHFDWSDDDKKSNQADMALNINPIWDIHVDAGATKLDFDLTKFKIKSLDIHGGAAAYDVKLGQPLAETNVAISGGVSSVTIKVPSSAACHIATNSGLTDNHFEGFNKNSDNTYETAGFANAKNKIFISLSGGISDYRVERY